MIPSHRLVLSFLFLLGASSLHAQNRRIAGPIDSAKIVPLNGNLRPAAMRRNDQGRVGPSFPLPGLTLYLKPSAAQQADLLRLLEQQQDPASPRYHQWLTPEEFADRFGLGAQDLAAAADWLRSRGFTVGKAARSRTWIAFSGTARQVEDTFHTEIHRYALNGKTHYANATEPSIPLALASAVAGLDGLDDLTPEQIEATSATGVHTLAPDDLAVIYDINSVYQSGIDGTGQKIVIAGSSDFNAAALADVALFRSKFNLPAMVPQVIRDTTYPDPGISGSLGEAHLDIEWAGAIARKAQIMFVYSNSFSHAVLYAIDNNLAPVISMSANAGCEADNTPANIAFYQGLAQQGNAQGITWVISGSDAASASCDANGADLPAVSGLAVRFPASVPEVTAVGGLEFDEAAGAGPFWSVTNTANGASALSYIPEMVWNDALALHALWGGGGGQSIYFPKPAWQTGPGVPNDQARDLPDVALAASFSHDGYIAINNQTAVTSGGTSASAPVFAGIVTLLNQYVVSQGIQTKPGLGNINPNLYRLAAAGNSPYHDITLGNNIIPCGAGTPDCASGAMGFSAAPGYDLASGLGSIDVAKFLNVWNSQPATTSAIVVSANPNPVYQQAADAQGNRWSTTITLHEEAGVGTTLTGFTINGTSAALSTFSSARIPALGSVTGTVKFATVSVPSVMVFGFTGQDASGQTWSQQVPVPFDAASGSLTVGGVANAASYQQVFAPGMLLYVAGTQLSPVAQIANSVPFLDFMGDVSASINGLAAPLYYVSPTQLDIQIPYEVPAGPATLTVTSFGQSASFKFMVGAAAPGIFAAQDGTLVPSNSGSRGGALAMFITGQGAVSPAAPTGTAPAANTPLSQLPAPVLPLSVTVGGIPAQVQFMGITPGLVGVTQVNFQIPTNAPLGPQPVVVTVGTVASMPVTLTVGQ
ncbi:MAG TPA: protease pro-enzyme activation domain-containing protein [Bryobacteraceae bacterium]|nr:protease pro-enzyme activation domain-containing protein [Bryobacteraceae bacterium]